MDTHNRRVVGKCSRCGGVVSIPTLIHMVGRVRASCESCGAVADETAGLPTIPMRGGRDVWSKKETPFDQFVSSIRR
jgi:uncharacterized Zn finger protein